jgi:hypothetical protein
VQVYPPRRRGGGGASESGWPEEEEDEGCEFAITYEKSLARALIEDAEWSEFFEYRGIV